MYWNTILFSPDHVATQQYSTMGHRIAQNTSAKPTVNTKDK